jgi:putative ABC transport system ATP-binding protein
VCAQATIPGGISVNQHIEVSEFAGSGAQTDLNDSIAVRFDRVTKDYLLDKVAVRALSGISVEVPRGETTFVCGPSGSGKSTLLNLMGLVDHPTSGSLYLFGQDVTGLSDAEAADFRSRHIGFIFQSFNLIPVLSLRENVEFPLLRYDMTARERRDRAAKYLEAVGLSDMMTRRPGEISGGQRQRVAVARALVTQPGLIIADEPTANLDSTTSREIVALLARMQADFNTTVVICTHETDLISPGSRTIEIIDGHLS